MVVRAPTRAMQRACPRSVVCLIYGLGQHRLELVRANVFVMSVLLNTLKAQPLLEAHCLAVWTVLLKQSAQRLVLSERRLKLWLCAVKFWRARCSPVLPHAPTRQEPQQLKRRYAEARRYHPELQARIHGSANCAASSKRVFTGECNSHRNQRTLGKAIFSQSKPERVEINFKASAVK
eukprot:2731910-Pleurochrysis_carterae.AAC.2